QREVFTPTPAPQVISPPPPAPAPEQPWALWVTASSLPDGSVRLEVELPGAGTLKAVAAGAVAVRAAESSRKHGKGKHSHTHTRARTSVATRDLAASTHVGTGDEEGLVTLTLTLDRGYRSLAARAVGLSATASLTFTAPGHPTLHAHIGVRFRKRAAKAARRAHKRKAAKREEAR
ncbi:MAG TPA: hypothetical protein VKV16_01385, partial [Solirubrobacteraceae bacterium]|nr:hypothetical protein [Solirubrobacteraceae bacterium]